MTQFFYYGWAGSAVDLGNAAARLGDYGGYSQKAEAGAIGNTTVTLDDPTGTIGIGADGLQGLGNFYVNETDCAAVGADGVNGIRLYSGYLRERTYRRGTGQRTSLITGAAREVEAALEDLNSVIAFQLLHTATAKRPAETDVARISWLLTDPARPLWSATNDAGYVDTTGPVNMDAADYTLQSAADVMHDCAVASDKNWFVGFWEATGSAFLWYADSNNSTKYTSALRISNVLADVDFATTWYPVNGDAALRRDPSRVYKGVAVPFASGYVYVVNGSFPLGFAWRDGTAPNANIKTAAAATALATRLVNDAMAEEDRITVSVQLPSSLATGIKHGQRIQCRFSHLVGNGTAQTDYSAWNWFRVMSLQVAQDVANDKLYTLTMELTPQTVPPQITCSTALSRASVASDINLTSGGASQSLSLAITPSGAEPVLLLAQFMGYSGDTPDASNMTAISGYATIKNLPGYSHSTSTVASKVGAGGVASTAAASFTTGFLGGEMYATLQVAIPTASPTVVQSASAQDATVAFGSAPTVGNMVVMVAWENGTTSVGPDADHSWTQLVYVTKTDSVPRTIAAGAWAHCVAGGELNSYHAQKTAGGASAFSIIEVAIS